MIRKYEPKDFQYLNDWVTDAETLLTFSGPEWTFPLTAEQIEEHQQKYPFKQLYVGITEENIPYAIGELIWNETNSPRLGRLLIGDPDERGKGIGTKFIKELMTELIALIDPKVIFLFVLEYNTPAIKCYEKIGFAFDDSEPRVVNLNGNEYRMRRMKYEL